MHPTLSPYQRQLVELLARREVVSIAQMAQHLYAGDPDGGPLNAETCVRIHLGKARGSLAAVGIAVRNVRGLGYSIARADRARALSLAQSVHGAVDGANTGDGAGASDRTLDTIAALAAHALAGRAAQAADTQALLTIRRIALAALG